MSIFGIVAVVFVCLILFMQFRIFYKAKMQLGNDLPEGIGNDRLYYFYTQSCPACKAMTPVVDSLSEKFPGVRKVDAAKEHDLAAKFNVTATPTTVFVKNGKIDRFFVGAKREKDLLELLENY